MPGPSEQPRTARRLALALLRLAAGVLLLAYLVHAGLLDIRALAKLFSAWWITVAAVVLIFLDIAFMAVRLSALFRPHRMHLSFSTSLQLTWVGFFFGIVLPGAAGGDVVRAYYAARENAGRRAEIITIMVVDRAVGMLSLLLLPLLFAPLFPGLWRSVPALQALLLLVGMIAAAMIAGFLVCMMHRSSFDRLARRSAMLTRILDTIAGYRHAGGTLLWALVLSLGANLAIMVVTILALLAMHPDAVAARMCLIIPMGHIVNVVPLTPGGLGIGESAFNALFRLSGLHGGAEALLGFRLWSLLTALPGLLLYLRGLKRHIFEEPQIAAASSDPVSR
jgi:glycosyltransferase 2 family protein